MSRSCCEQTDNLICFESLFGTMMYHSSRCLSCHICLYFVTARWIVSTKDIEICRCISLFPCPLFSEWHCKIRAACGAPEHSQGAKYQCQRQWAECGREVPSCKEIRVLPPRKCYLQECPKSGSQTIQSSYLNLWS